MKKIALALLVALLSACTTPAPHLDHSLTARSQSPRVKFIVIHYTVSDLPRSIKILTEQVVSSHYLLTDTDKPKFYVLVDESRQANHAGVSNWKTYTQLNVSSIGIEIVNPGFTDTPTGRVWYPYSEAQVQSLYEQAAARFGTIDVSIQNAGVITIDYYDRMPKADFEKVLAVNTTGVWLCCREAAKYMVKQNHGSLINTSSGQGRQGFIYTPHYAASKMGVIGITQSLAHELAPWNITVNAFCPGIIESEMWDYNDRVWGEILSTEQKRYGKGELMAEWVEGIPMKRAGKPEDVAGLVAFLASDDARYLTGQTINIDGGLIMS